MAKQDRSRGIPYGICPLKNTGGSRSSRPYGEAQRRLGRMMQHCCCCVNQTVHRRQSPRSQKFEKSNQARTTLGLWWYSGAAHTTINQTAVTMYDIASPQGDSQHATPGRPPRVHHLCALGLQWCAAAPPPHHGMAWQGERVVVVTTIRIIYSYIRGARKIQITMVSCVELVLHESARRASREAVKSANTVPDLHHQRRQHFRRIHSA